MKEKTKKTNDSFQEDWDYLRGQAAIAVLQALVSHQKGYTEAIKFSNEIGVDTGHILACTAVEYADALIKKLKQNGKTHIREYTKQDV